MNQLNPCFNVIEYWYFESICRQRDSDERWLIMAEPDFDNTRPDRSRTRLRGWGDVSGCQRTYQGCSGPVRASQELMRELIQLLMSSIWLHQCASFKCRCVCLCAHARVYVRVFVWMQIYKDTHAYSCLCKYCYMFVCSAACMCLCMYTPHVWILVYLFVYLPVYMPLDRCRNLSRFGEQLNEALWPILDLVQSIF